MSINHFKPKQNLLLLTFLHGYLHIVNSSFCLVKFNMYKKDIFNFKKMYIMHNV